MTRALFVSNGHGEDVIAAALARRLQARGVELVAVPLVGRGTVYERIGVTVIGPRSELPGGGFTMMSLAAFWADLRSGLVRSTLRHWRAVADAAVDASRLRNVVDLGNPMLDALDGEAGVDVAPPWVMDLPGTRADAHVSFPVMLEAMRRPAIRNAELLVAWAPPDRPAAPAGWAAEATGRDCGVVLRCRFRDPGGRHSDGRAAEHGRFRCCATSAPG